MPVRTPRPNTIADQLEHTAKLLRQHGPRALTAADERTAIGYPSSTLGDGTPRGTTELTPTEASASQLLERGDRHLARQVDLALAMRLAWGASLRLQQLIVDTLGHADPDSSILPKQTGAGYCGRCTQWVPGSENDRLRSGWCDACRKAWDRAGRPDRGLFEQQYQPDPGGDRGHDA